MAGGAPATSSETAPASYAIGAVYPALPAGAIAINENGATYYPAGDTWFKAWYGANSVFYAVVPTP